MGVDWQQRVALTYRQPDWLAIDLARRSEDNTAHAMTRRGSKNVVRTNNVCRKTVVDVGDGSDEVRLCGEVVDDIDALHDSVNGIEIANITLAESQPRVQARRREIFAAAAIKIIE